ncbi:CBS domain-containing protein [Streptomyces sp. NPDC001272]
MQHLEVADLMTDEVASVTPATPSGEAAKLHAQHDFCGVPVLDDEDRVVGVVSQTALSACAAPLPHPGPQAGTPAPPPAAGATPAVTVRAEETAADAARLTARRGIERLPFVDTEDPLVGIVTRRVVIVPVGDVEVHVVDGIVTLDGAVQRESQLRVPEALAGQTAGVVAVISHVAARNRDPAMTRAGAPCHAMPR